ncbi:hypothetical protein BDN70DRAFT_348937 [Pholiota conissans]|uniref:Uncharacterized protein n=1 Tax=Pholiota conissans TaxID=109636 RepID=A0A9P6CUH4_9AGAR|nr:hypothetical protein BDN70DRAFT_348937 [Pholiota conissans]
MSQSIIASCSDEVISWAATDEAKAHFESSDVNEPVNSFTVAELFKIPDGLSPAWQQFFSKVAKFHEKQCATNPFERKLLVNRSQFMEATGRTEIEMVMHAIILKENGNLEFKKGDVAKAALRYHFAVITFATPDVLNNLAACHLKLHKYDKAEDLATRALEMDMFTNPASIAKAYYRRASARLHMAKFKEAKEDAIAAIRLHTALNSSTEELLVQIQSIHERVSSPDEIQSYLNEQPQCTTNIFSEPEKENIKYVFASACIAVPLSLQALVRTQTSPPSY